jgi:NitT/TauT family transport system substrate-binding protein
VGGAIVKQEVHEERLMMKRLSFLMGLGVTLVCLAACQSGTAQTERQPLRLEYTQWWGDYTAIIAQEMGFFEKQGVDVELVPYEVFSRALPDLAAGKIDLGLFGINDALNVARRVPLKVVAVYDQGGDSTIVAAPSILNVADLKGKTIGVPAGSTYELFVREMLKSAGLSLEDVTLVSIDPETVAERMPDEVQAAYVWDPYQTQLINQGNRILFSSEQGTRLFPDVITLRADTAADRPEDVKAFLRAWFEALEYRRANPDESNAIISRVTGLPLEEITAGQENIFLQNAADNEATFAQNPGENTDSIHYTARTNLDYLINLGTASQAIDLNQLLDPSYLPQP